MGEAITKKRGVAATCAAFLALALPLLPVKAEDASPAQDGASVVGQTDSALPKAVGTPTEATEADGPSGATASRKPPIVLKSDHSRVIDEKSPDPAMRPQATIGGGVSADSARTSVGGLAIPVVPPPTVITVVTEPPPQPSAEHLVETGGKSIDQTENYLRTEKILRSNPASSGSGAILMVIPSPSTEPATTGAEAEIRKTERMRILDKLDRDSDGHGKILILP